MEIQFTRQHDMLVCIDSDGTVFDSMELKHKECFGPAFVDGWDLQNVSQYAREVWEYVNLYSLSRGINRFKAVIRALELLGTRKEAVALGYTVPDLTELKHWAGQASSLSRDPLAEASARRPDDDAMRRAIAWTDTVNIALSASVKSIPPFPGALQAMRELGTFCDIVVVSTAPHARLLEEWQNSGIDGMTAFIAGQEYGSKAVCIRKAMQAGGYLPERTVKIGDAPVDHQAAVEAGVLFMPVVPGDEHGSWARILQTDIPLLRENCYRERMPERIARFEKALTAPPSWMA